MTPDELARWKRVEQVFDQLLEAAPADRATLLDRLSVGDDRLRSEVEALLAADGAAGDFLERPAFALLGLSGEVVAAAPPPESGRCIGPYRLTRELGRGGMGTVFLAERADGQFDQQVALKLIRQDSGTPELVQRFLSERQILARLNHPHIARLLDGATTAEGQPWFALEYVEGEPITAYAEHRGLSLEQRFDLFTQVADAVRHAHSQGVIHRDLKPSNILVTAAGDVKLLDFGIAKDTTRSDTNVTTRDSSVLTPEYCAPEQVLGQPASEATDVYAIGTVLYELLTGQRAHRLAHHSPAAVYAAVCETDPVLPSRAILEPGTHATEAEAQRRSRQLRGDLDAILTRALRKSPEQRYSSVNQLLEDIERFRVGLPVRARRATTAYRFRKLLSRHQVRLAALVLISGFAFVAASLVDRSARPERQRSAVARRLFEEGRAAFRRVDLLGAQRLYRAALAEDSSLTIAAFYGGEVAFMIGNPEEGYRLTALARRRAANLPRFERLRVQHAWNVLGNTPARLATAESLLLGYPNEPIALLTYGNEIAWAGFLDSAQYYYQRTIALLSSRPDSEPWECLLCDGLSGLVHAYMASDSLQAAERTVRQWLEIGRDSVSAVTSLAIVLSMQDRHEEAMNAYRVLSQLIPSQSQLYWVLATVMLRAGRANDLVRILDEQVRIQGDPEALWFEVIALRNAGRVEEAVAAARQNRLPPPLRDSVDHSWTGLAMLEAQALHESRRFAAAASLFDSTSKAVLPWSWVGEGIEGRYRSWNLAQEAKSLALLGDTIGLTRVHREISASAPMSAWVRDRNLAHYVGGLVFRARHDTIAALAEFRTAYFPGYAPPDLAAAELLIRLNRAPEAVTTLQRTLRVSGIQANSTYQTIAGLHYGLARAFDAAGVRDSARDHYLWVARAWEHGDPIFRAEARKVAVRASLLFAERPL